MQRPLQMLLKFGSKSIKVMHVDKYGVIKERAYKACPFVGGCEGRPSCPLRLSEDGVCSIQEAIMEEHRAPERRLDVFAGRARALAHAGKISQIGQMPDADDWGSDGLETIGDTALQRTLSCRSGEEDYILVPAVMD